MEIIFLSEMGFKGKIPRTHSNMRVEFAQMCALNATHWPMLDMHSVNDQYDIAILLVGKTTSFRNQLLNLDIISNARRFAKKVIWMQEGPSWIFQDMPLEHQIWHYNVLMAADGLLCENKTDIPYFKGLVGDSKWILDIPSVMITDNVQHVEFSTKEDKIIVGGNFCRWYGGFDSYICARDLNVPIYLPSMGRKIPGEELLDDVVHLPYMDWTNWIITMSKFKYAIHLMPTSGAGTFSMNCAYLGIPCIAYNDLDTQTNLHPNLSVCIGDVHSARVLLNKLKSDRDFYHEQSLLCRDLFTKFHSEESFINYMSKLNTL
jgi:hypothetical protein